MPAPSTAAQTPQWHFDSIPAGGMERASITGEFFSKNTPLESVIREGIQNSLDAHAEGKGAVKVRVYFSDIGATSLPAADYAKYLAGAEDHLANPKNGLNNKPGSDESCVYLVLEDFNTNGLSGNVEERPPESEEDRAKWNYHNYFFRESNSSKDNDGKLGSWGAGKATFSRASRLRTAFAYSVRDVKGDQRRFLAARMTLNVHADADNVRWEPHAWFGLEQPEDPSNKLRYTKTPILEKGALDAFAKDFRLSRGDKPGTSIVIPYLNLTTDDGKAAFNKTNLVRAVVRNFLPALLQGDLEVEISTGDEHDKVVLDKDSVGKHSSALPEEPASDDDITKAHYSMIREALSKSFNPARVVTLKNANPGKTPWLEDQMFSGIDLKEVKKLLQSDKPVLFKVPMSLLKKSADGKKVEPVEDTFKVIICRTDFPRQVKAVYYRIGLLIGGIRGTPKNSNYVIVTPETLDLFAKKRKGVKVTIFTSEHYDKKQVSHRKISGADIKTFNAQYPKLAVRYNESFHDRFLIIYDKELYLINAPKKHEPRFEGKILYGRTRKALKRQRVSLKDLGRKCFRPYRGYRGRVAFIKQD